MRLRSDIFAAALIRRAGVEGAAAYLRRRGSPEAGAIFIKIDRLDGCAALFGPAPQSEKPPPGVGRLFSRQHAEQWIEPADAEARLKKEIAFDPDLWIVEIEDREGRVLFDVTQDSM